MPVEWIAVRWWINRSHTVQLEPWAWSRVRSMDEKNAPPPTIGLKRQDNGRKTSTMLGMNKKKCLDKKKKSVYRYDIGLPRIISQGMRSPKTCLYWLNQILHPYISFSLLCLEKGMVEHHNHPRERLVVGCFIARLAGQWLSIQMDVNEKYITTI